MRTDNNNNNNNNNDNDDDDDDEHRREKINLRLILVFDIRPGHLLSPLLRSWVSYHFDFLTLPCPFLFSSSRIQSINVPFC